MRADVVGAGFSGLATAFYLAELGHSVRVFERADRAGGLIRTQKTEFGLVETAANALLNSPAVEELFSKTGVPLSGTKKESRSRYIYRERPRRWPLSVPATVSLATLVPRLIFNHKSLLARENETIHDWGIRILGPEATRYFLETGLQGIYAGDPARMSASLIVSVKVRKGERKRRVFPRGSVAPPNGMGQLIESLEKYLRSKGVEFHYGKTLEAREARDKTFFCGSAHAASKWLRDVAPEAARRLDEIEIRPVTTITAFFEPSNSDIRGFGMLFPRDQGFEALGVLFNADIFEGRSSHRAETWIYSGANAGIENVLRDRRKLASDARPLHYVATNWPEAIPHYTVELERILKEGISLPNGIHLVGNYLGDLGLAKILERARRTVEEATA